MSVAARLLTDWSAVADLNMRRLQESASELVARIDDVMAGDEANWEELAQLVAHLEARIAEQVLIGTRWDDLKRHLRFREGIDWADIVRSDWPSVRHRLTSPQET